jgi:hypothetical protein
VGLFRTPAGAAVQHEPSSVPAARPTAGEMQRLRGEVRPRLPVPAGGGWGRAGGEDGGCGSGGGTGVRPGVAERGRPLQRGREERFEEMEGGPCRNPGSGPGGGDSRPARPPFDGRELGAVSFRPRLAAP